MQCTHKEGIKGPMMPTGPLKKNCQIPCKRPAIDHFWRCGCFYNEEGRPHDDGGMAAFEVPARSLPFMPHCPVRMGEHTMISDPVYAFPVSIDRLVAAALATKRALYVRKLIRPILERSEIPAARKIAETFHLDNTVMDDTFRSEILRQHKLVCQVGEPWLGGDVVCGLGTWEGEDESEQDRTDEGFWTQRVRRDPYDVRTLREIHAMMHAAYSDANEAWIMVRNDKDIFTSDEVYYHSVYCSDQPWDRRWPCNRDLDHDSRVGCRSLDSDYWDNHLRYWWECQWDALGDSVDGHGSVIEQELDEDVTHNCYDEYFEWWRRLRADMKAQRVWEMKNWRDKLIGQNGQHSWLQRNVVEVLEEAFSGVKITVINPAVLHGVEDNADLDRIRNFMPMAWVHLTSGWKRTTNLPFSGPADTKNKSEGQNFECHQGYAPVIPGDPGHWYSNAARDPNQSGAKRPSAEEVAPLLNFQKLFQLDTWMHPLQYLPSGYENVTQAGSKKGTSGKQKDGGDRKNNVTLKNNTIYHHFYDIAELSDAKEWPALVELRKVVHQDGAGEGQHSNDNDSIDWNHWDKSDPKSDGDLDHRENKAHIEEIRQYLDIILYEINPRLDATNSYVWPDNEREHSEHEKHSRILADVVFEIQTLASKADNAVADRYKALLADFHNFQTDYETRRKNLQQGAKHVERIVKQHVQQAKYASVDLDKLRRKRYRDLKNIHTRQEVLQTERDDLNGQNDTLVAEGKSLEDINRKIGRERARLHKEKGELDEAWKQLADENEELHAKTTKLRREVTTAKGQMDKLRTTIKELRYEKVRIKLAIRKDNLKKRRLESLERSKSKNDKPSSLSSDDEDDSDNDDDDDLDEQPPKKKQKTTDSTGDVKAGKQKARPKAQNIKGNAANLQPSKKQQTSEGDPGSPVAGNSQSVKMSPAKPPKGKGTAATARITTKSMAKSPAKADPKPTETTTKSPKKTTTKADTQSPSKPAAAKPIAKAPAKTTTTTTTKPAVPKSKTTKPPTTKKATSKELPTKPGRITRSTTSSLAASSPAPAPSPSPTPAKAKVKAKPAPKLKTPAPPKANSKAKAPAKTPKATIATAASSLPVSAASQPTRTSRRQAKDSVEVEKVSDPDKAAKKSKRKI